MKDNNLPDDLFGDEETVSSLKAHKFIQNLPVLDISKMNKGYLNGVCQDTYDQLSEQGSDLEILMAMKPIMEVLKGLEKHVKKGAADEADLLHKEDRKMYGLNFTLSNSAKTYDFSTDDYWIKAKSKIDELSLKLKEYQEHMIKAIDVEHYVVMIDDVEHLVMPAKIKSQGTQYVSIKIPS